MKRFSTSGSHSKRARPGGREPPAPKGDVKAIPARPRLQPLNAVDLINVGRTWHGRVWVGQHYDERDQLIENFNEIVRPYGFTLGRGWQPADPVIRGGRARTYDALAAELDANTAANAVAFRNFLANPDARLADLPPTLRELALIVLVAEVARGYESSLAEHLRPFLDDLAAGDAQWADFAQRFPPSLTYAQDMAQEYEAGSEDDDDEDEEDEDEDEDSDAMMS